LQLVGSKSHGARSQDDEKLDMKIVQVLNPTDKYQPSYSLTNAQRPQKLLKLKEGKLDQAAEEVDMEIVNLADELSPASYGVSCTSNFCSGKSVRLPKRKPGFSYSNGQQPDLPFLHKADIDDHIFHSGNSDHEGDFHSPSVLLNADVDYGDPFESYQKNHSLTPSPYVSVSVEAAMSGLSDPAGPRTPAPRVDLSFENRVFDFSAFNEQPEEQFAFSSPLTHAGLKRPRSGTPELPQRKCRRIQKVELIMNEKSSVQESEPLKPDAQQRSTPAWVDEFDAALINDLKGIVDFVD
jgi:ATP-dependent DNA helicase HFM1/MER3